MIKKLAVILGLLLILGIVNAADPEITVQVPRGDTIHSHRTFTIDYNVVDSDTNAIGMKLDLNFSSSQSQGTGTVLTNDANVTCTDLNVVAASCSFTFDFAAATAPSSGLYFVLAFIDDGNGGTNFDTNGSFNFVKLSKEDALCASISGDLAIANGCVDSDGFEDATTSTLSIGTLEIGDNSGLVILMIVVAIIVAVLISAITAFLVLGKKLPLGIKPK